MNKLLRAIRIILRAEHLRRTLLIMTVVGSWLTAVNLSDLILAEGLTPAILGKILLNYLTPFVVANLGLLAHAADHHPDSLYDEPEHDQSR